MTQEVTFEKKIGDNWQPVPSANLRVGDVTRMIEDGAVLTAEDGCSTEYRVANLNGVDPDSHQSFHLGLAPILNRR